MKLTEARGHVPDEEKDAADSVSIGSHKSAKSTQSCPCKLERGSYGDYERGDEIGSSGDTDDGGSTGDGSDLDFGSDDDEDDNVGDDGNMSILSAMSCPF
jgi:hypothetical protein